MTALVQNPDLTVADRHSLLLSCMKSATDGLMPDGRDAALVIFNSKGPKDSSGKDTWIKKVQYLPMYAGILKKVRQSKELASVVTHIVYEADKKLGKFEYFLGDDERIVHEPYLGPEPRGNIIAAYCIAKLKDGTVIREVMTFQDIEKVRRTSKSGDDNGKPKGIWAAWYEEMARKTVFRRCAKWLPQSIELTERVFKNDDSMETFTDFEADAPTMITDQTPGDITADVVDDNGEVKTETARSGERGRRGKRRKRKAAKKENRRRQRNRSLSIRIARKCFRLRI